MSYPETTSFHQEFLKGNPKCLGRTLSLIGSLQGCVGAGLFYTASYIVMYSGIPFWGAIFNLIAGSLSVAAVSKPSMSLIKGAVGLSIVICIISFVGLMLNVVDFIPDYNCPGLYDCKGYIIGGHVIRGIFICTYIVQFFICVRIAVVGCRAQDHHNPTVIHANITSSHREFHAVIIQNNATAEQPYTESNVPYISS